MLEELARAEEVEKALRQSDQLWHANTVKALREVLANAKAFCEADIEYPRLTNELNKGRPHYSSQDRWDFRRMKGEKLRPVNEKKRGALLWLKKTLCGWEPKTHLAEAKP